MIVVFPDHIHLLFLLCCVVLSVLSSFAIILLRKIELTALIYFILPIVWLSVFCVLFDLILCVPSTIVQLNREGFSWVEPVLS